MVKRIEDALAKATRSAVERGAGRGAWWAVTWKAVAWRVMGRAAEWRVVMRAAAWRVVGRAAAWRVVGKAVARRVVGREVRESLALVCTHKWALHHTQPLWNKRYQSHTRPDSRCRGRRQTMTCLHRSSRKRLASCRSSAPPTARHCIHPKCSPRIQSRARPERPSCAIARESFPHAPRSARARGMGVQCQSSSHEGRNRRGPRRHG